MNDNRPATVDEYIRSFPPHIRATLQRVRQTISASAPEATETISYGMPAFKLDGKPLVYFAGWQKHVGFYALPSGNKAFAKELSPYHGAKGSVRFPLDQPIPYQLIERIVKFRVAEVRGDKR